MTKSTHRHQGKSQMTAREPTIQVEEVTIVSEQPRDPATKLLEQEAAAVFGIPDKHQQQTIRELTALYYGLLGPQNLLQAASTVSRPPYPVRVRQRRIDY
jgi:hypothetical protein